jgi:hypothetical protein
MILIVSKYLLRKGFRGITFWPFIVLREKHLKKDLVFLNHERIHYRQQLELLVIPFYVWYGIEFLVRWAQYKNRHTAYRNISFEREAYANEKDLNYLKSRFFLKFLFFI